MKKKSWRKLISRGFSISPAVPLHPTWHLILQLVHSGSESSAWSSSSISGIGKRKRAATPVIWSSSGGGAKKVNWIDIQQIRAYYSTVYWSSLRHIYLTKYHHYTVLVFQLKFQNCRCGTGTLQALIIMISLATYKKQTNIHTGVSTS